MSQRALICGAGIGGLSAALALAQSGWQVDLRDKAKALEEAGAGVQLSPNATRILQDLGVIDAVTAHATAPDAVVVRRGHDAALLSRMPLGPRALARWHAPSLVIHRADLQGILLDAVQKHASISLTLNAAKADTALEGADVLIGADGLRSAIRGALGVAGALKFTGQVAWRALVPMADVPPLLRGNETALWLGAKTHLVHYPLRKASVLNVVAIAEMDETGSGWSEQAAPEKLFRAFAGWAKAPRELLQTAPEWRCWSLYDRDPAPSWGVGEVTLLGDAAHPSLPFLAQGAAQAIEDAAALARHLKAGTVGSVAAKLRAYEAERIPRTARVQLAARQQAKIYHLSGPMAFARDLVMRSLGPERLQARYDWIYCA